jgi:hypothetical protein
MEQTIRYVEKTFSESGGFTLTYADLLTDLASTLNGANYTNTIYTPTVYDDEGEIVSEPTEEQAAINDIIEKVTSFNIGVYAVVQFDNKIAHRSYYVTIPNDCYKHLMVNGYYMDTPELDEDVDIPDVKIVSKSQSVLFNNATEVVVSIDNRFIKYDSAGLPITDEQGNPVYGGITTGTYFYLYFIVESITGEQVHIPYKFTYVPVIDESNEGNNDNSDSQNEWIIDNEDALEDLPEGTPVEYEFVQISDPRWMEYVFLNTVTLKELYELPGNRLNAADPLLRVFISPLCPQPFSFSLTVTIGGKSSLYDFNYEPQLMNVTYPRLPRVQKMNNPDVSYTLLRTNPKLTGNVKVVVDSSDNIYLDTFKVSDTLSNRKYRHIKVGYDSYYGSSLMKFFKDMPAQDLYKVEDKCFNMFTTVQSYKDQYYDTYFSGVKTNDDKMYSENFALLAPLCIKRVMPDFFLVFRVEKKTADAYNEHMNDDEKIKYFLKHGKIVKCYDMRLGSKLGTYIRNIYKQSSGFCGDMYESYSTDNYNKYIGISVDRGVVSSKYESGFMTKNIKSQVELNDFYTEGFERNHLVSKDIINFEFMFNDESAELFSINTYFGLYVKVNTQDVDFSCIGYASSTSTSDEDGESVKSVGSQYKFDSSIYGFKAGTDLPNTQYASLIYGLTTPNEFIRLNKSLLDAKEVSNYVLKPYKNILTAKSKIVDASTCYSYVTCTLHETLEIGEQIRVIDTLNNVIYEVIVCNYDNALITQGNFLDNNNLSEISTNYYNELGTKYIIKRVGMYTTKRLSPQDFVSEEEYKDALNAKIKEQISQLFFAFRKFKEEDRTVSITSYKKNNDTLSIVAYNEGVLFERICYPSGFDDVLRKYVLTTEEENSVMTFFGNYEANKTILNLNNLDNVVTKTPYWKTKSYAYLYPIHFEIAGSRMAYIVGFVNTKEISDANNNIFTCKIDNYEFFNNEKTILYYTTEKNKYGTNVGIYEQMNVNVFANDKELDSIYTAKKSFNYLKSFDDLDYDVINIKNPLLKNNILSLYSSYPLNHGVCSILQIKDFDFDVLDSTHIIEGYGSVYAIGPSGEYTKKSLFNYDPKSAAESGSRPMGEIVESEEDEVFEEVIEFNQTSYYNITKKNFNKERSMIYSQDGVSSNDSILLYNDGSGVEYYVIKHMTLPEFLTEIALRIRSIRNTSPQYCYDHTSGNYLITINNAYNILSLFGVGDYGDFAGFILRPYIGSSVAYNKKYSLFNAKITFTDNCHGIQEVDEKSAQYSFLGEKAFVWNSYYGINLDKDTGYTIEESNEDDYENPGYVLEDKADYFKSTYPICSNDEENIKDYIDKRQVWSDLPDYCVICGSRAELHRSEYFKSLYLNNHTSTDVSLVSPYVCKWKGIGTDARIENMRLMYDFDNLRKTDSYYIPGKGTYDSYLGILYLKDRNITSISDGVQYSSFKKYINRSLIDIVRDDNDYVKAATYEKDFILKGEGSLDDILYDPQNTENKFSVAYTAGSNTLEFISGGVKVKIKSNNDNIVDFSKYNGYSAAFICLPIHNINSTKQLELIVDETKCEILFIWYCYTNSLQYGMKYKIDGLERTNGDNTNLFTGMLGVKINYTGTINDIISRPIIADGKTYSAIKIPDTMGLSTLIDENSGMSEFKLSTAEAEAYGIENKDSFIRFGKKLCSSTGYIVVTNMGMDPNFYTKKTPILVSGRIYNYTPTISNLSKTYPYYNESGYITPVNPFIWHKEKDAFYNFHEEFTDSGLQIHSVNAPNIFDTLLFTDNINDIPSSLRTLDDLKKLVNDCGIIIKKQHGTYTYNTVSQLLEVSVIDPIEYNRTDEFRFDLTDKDKKRASTVKVHSTYAEPVMKDMLSFFYDSESIKKSINVDEGRSETLHLISDLEKLFKKSFDGSNVAVSDIKKISQIWINKYTEVPNYCILGSRKKVESALLSFDEIYDMSIILDPWYRTFRKYYNETIKEKSKIYENKKFNMPYEYFSDVAGYSTGYEVKSFLGSKGISLKSDKIEIESWKNVEVLPEQKCIKINITDSLIYLILNTPAFVNSWTNITKSGNEWKIKYIKNFILNFININNKTKFEVRRSNKLLKKMKFNSSYDSTKIEYENFKNELKHENGKYYMYLYVEDPYTYFAKMTITL